MASLRGAQKVIRGRGSKKCPRHQGREVVFVCEDCNGELICTKCVSTIHQKHTVEEISDVIPQVRVKIQEFVSKTQTKYIPEFRGELQCMDSKIIRNKNHFLDVIDKIQKQYESLKQELDNILNKLITVCREIEDKNNDVLQNHKAELQLKIEELDARAQELKDALQTGTDTQIYDMSREIPNDIIKPALQSYQDVEFNGTSILRDQLENLMGQLSSPITNENISVFRVQQHGNTSEDNEVLHSSDAGSTTLGERQENFASEDNEVHHSSDDGSITLGERQENFASEDDEVHHSSDAGSITLGQRHGNVASENNEVHETCHAGSLTLGQTHDNVESWVDEVRCTSDVDTESTATATTTKQRPTRNKSSKDKVQTFKVFKEFTSEKNIYIIQSASDNQVWVKTGDGLLQLLNNTGQIQKSIQLPIPIKDFCVSPATGDVWFCSRDDNNVRKLTGVNNSTVMFNTDSKPVSICMAPDCNILVGMQQQIVKYTQRRQLLCQSGAEVKWLIKKIPVVRFPYRISSCPVTRDIAVADWDKESCEGEGKAHVSILNKDLQLKFRYYGCDIESFYPNEVCYSDTGDIYIAVSTSIYQINDKGELIQTVYTDTQKQARFLCVQSNGDIWAVFGGASVIILQKQ